MREAPGAERILVVADAPAMVQEIRQRLEGCGYDLFAARDAARAIDLLGRRRPHLIITDIDLPDLDGWTLIKQIRAHGEGGFVAVIFLAEHGSAEGRVRGYRLGADDCVPKPLNLEELELRVQRALRRRTRIETSLRHQTLGPHGPDWPGIRGTLDQVGLPALLTLLEMERKTGLLAVASGSPEEQGRLWIKDGQVVRARIDDSEDLTNAEAVFYLLRWTAGRFLFRPREVGDDDEVRQSTPRLLMEGTRRIDEMERSDG